MVFDDKVEKMRCLFFSCTVARFTEHSLFNVAEYGSQGITAFRSE